MTMQAPSLLTKAGNFLAKQNIQSYVVGGFVRDVLLGRDTADIDIAMEADALNIAPQIAAALSGKHVLLDEEHGISRVVLTNEEAPSTKGQWELDFSTIEGSIEQDLARRDFTIDAMAVDLGKMADQHHLPTLPHLDRRREAPPRPSILIDPFGGWTDLHQRVIRAVTETAFASDAVRLLRAARLAAELGFTIDAETEALIQHHSHLITGVAGERIREELLRLLAVSRAEQLLPHLDQLGLLTAIIPELAGTKGVEQPKEHSWDVFEHSLKTVAAIDFLLRQGTWEHADSEEVLAATPWSEELSQHFDLKVSSGSTRRSLLKLAALLHDIAKPQTKAIDASGRMRFLGHAEDGAAIAAGTLERLRFAAREVKLVEIVVRYHLRPGQMSHDELPSRRAIYRYFRDTGEAGIDILFFSLADHLATRGPFLDLTHWREHAHMVKYVLSQRFEQESVVSPPKLIDGHDLINVLGINQGPKIGELLEAVREAQASGELTTREEALSYIERLLTSPPGALPHQRRVKPG